MKLDSKHRRDESRTLTRINLPAYTEQILTFCMETANK